MNFCSDCGKPVIRRQFKADNRPHFQCTACGTIHYRNPKVLVSCYATWQHSILWIRRNTEPMKGLWSAPSGFVEEDENLMQAAARELYEETCASVDQSRMQLHLVGNLTRMNQIYIVYRAPLLKPEFCTTAEASEVRLFRRHEFPIKEFAYPEVAANVDLIYRDLENGRFGVYMGTLENGSNSLRQVSTNS